MCNGTRLICRSFHENFIDAEIAIGDHAGKRVFIPRIPLFPSEEAGLPFILKRKQFPIRAAFALTINKSQGQTLPYVGLYLASPVFSHGQLYVAMSRVQSGSNLKVLVTNGKLPERSGTYTKNVVYKEALLF
jgi:ATP-dependent DNA helicase PIF1